MKKIAIIGAGASGLTSAVAVLKAGMQPKIFEASARMGGVWGPDKRIANDPGKAWRGMHVNISRFNGLFNDFPWPANTEDFPTSKEVYAYLRAYAEHNQLNAYINFNSPVREVIPCGNQWLVCSEEKQELFDGVMVCTNKFSIPMIPAFKGLENLKKNKKITCLHSADYQPDMNFANKKILIVGGSFSGTAIAEELADVAQITHLFRQPRWVLKRYLPCAETAGPVLPRDLLKSRSDSVNIVTAEQKYQKFRSLCAEQNDYPEWRMDTNTPMNFTVADHYFDAVSANMITPVRGEIDYFTDSSVVLKDGRSFEFDTVIFCTGYQRNLSFLPEHLRLKKNDRLYEDTFPINENGLAYIGMYPNARGAVFPLIQMQAEYAAAVFSGRLQLPSKAEQKDEVENTAIERDEIGFSTSIAKKLGVMPDFSACNDGLRHMLFDGPFIPAQYRLHGPNKNPEYALKSIEEANFYKRRVQRSKDKVSSLATLCLFALEKKKRCHISTFDNFTPSPSR